MSGMTELFGNLKRFVDAGDKARFYKLSFDEVEMIVNQIETLISTSTTPVHVYSFQDIKDEAKRMRSQRLAEHGPEEIVHFPKDTA